MRWQVTGGAKEVAGFSAVISYAKGPAGFSAGKAADPFGTVVTVFDAPKVRRLV